MFAAEISKDVDSLLEISKRYQCGTSDSVRPNRTAMRRTLAVDDRPHISRSAEITTAVGTVPIFQTFVGCGNCAAEMEFEQEEDPRAP
jgi:hypothetical protein